MELAFALERFVIGGGSSEAYVDEIGSESPRELVGEIEDSLRALLRDVLCGYLDPELKHAADDILLRSSEPVEITARDIRDEPRRCRRTRRIAGRRSRITDTGGARAASLSPSRSRSPSSPNPSRSPNPTTPSTKHRAPSTSRSEPEGLEPRGEDEELASGVTPSADWGFDEDPESYSAPV